MKTSRLYLTLLSESDLDEAIALFKEPDVMKFIFPMVDKSDEERKVILKVKIEEIHQDIGFFWTVRNNADELMGIVNLNPIPGKTDIQIGWIFSPRFAGQGYAYEASKLIFDFGIHERKVNPIYAIIEEGNHKSVRLAEKLGLKWSESYEEDGIKINKYKYQ
ncbi:GNAT family N-acetyltransferase [Flammeovirga sp. MY04]|uniref:GNAT family N-acetyltransferase n=1 Tax=Flammeovirga sp. MY04 TaxID=1191459 RepID=UPI0008063F78|nr:GNAT family N-acetyltransferase [Flammeovirga sp. MY04]ANQ49838.1 GNAT family N-acetyltransferase [Flammeovirga sp. MY04]